MDKYVELAKEAIETYLKKNITIKPPKNLPKEMLREKAGVFVSIHKKNGELRGCIGTFLPTKENIAEEIISNAISAAFFDPRFYPIQENELKDLEISVDILSKPEPVDSIEILDAKKYGIIVRTNDGRTGLLLPDIEGVDTVEEQILIACQKAGINPFKEKYQIYRFTVVRHK
jgi:AmmeMemoRadiSam system protein A